MFVDLTTKQEQFNEAMRRYERNPIYLWTGRVVSFLNVSLQVILVVLAWAQTSGVASHALALIIAFVLADFVNGWVHLYMDNCDDYQSPVGPFNASFHLHHRTPRYKENPIVIVYYHESGSKLWLVVRPISTSVWDLGERYLGCVRLGGVFISPFYLPWRRFLITSAMYGKPRWANSLVARESLCPVGTTRATTVRTTCNTRSSTV